MPPAKKSVNKTEKAVKKTGERTKHVAKNPTAKERAHRTSNQSASVSPAVFTYGVVVPS